MPTEDRSGTWYANRQRARAIYSLYLIEQQALNQGTANRINSNGGSVGESTVFYSFGTTNITGEELAVALLANSAVAPLPPAPPTEPTNVIVAINPPEAGGILVSWTASSSYVTPTYTIVASPGDITKTLIPGTIPETSIEFNEALDGIIVGTDYTFVVTAENDLGISPPSTASAPIKAIMYADSPTDIAATDGENGQTTVSWTDSAYDGESPIVSYTVYSYSDDDPIAHVVVAYPPSSSAVLAELTNGFQYMMYVSVTNGFGENPSAGGPSPEITPVGPPTQPLNVSAVAGTGNAYVTWEAPLNDGGSSILGYTISSDPPEYTEDLPATPLSVTATGLTNGTEYTFTLLATNTGYSSLASEPSLPVTPLGAADAPTAVVATPGNASASVTWDDPVSDGGSVITSYTVTSTPGDIIVTGNLKPAVVSGLVNGTPYTFTVFATNAIGDSLESSPSVAVTPAATVPDPPQDVSANLISSGLITVSWSPPLSDGGSTILAYKVYIDPPDITSPQSVDASYNQLDFDNTLLNGNLYTFTVAAANIIGESLAGAPATATPFTEPSDVQSVVVIPRNQGAIVTWVAPASDGGSLLTNYSLNYKESTGTVYTTINVGPSYTSHEITSLTNGTIYDFFVGADNAYYTGGGGVIVQSSPAVTVADPPTITSLEADASGSTVTITITPSLYDGGGNFQNYFVEEFDGMFTDFPTSSPAVLGPLLAGTYQFTVKTVTSVGTSLASGLSSSVTVT